MENIDPPSVPAPHPDRFLECQAALEAAFGEIERTAVERGWTAGEVAAALVDLADNHMLALGANADVDLLLESVARTL